MRRYILCVVVLLMVATDVSGQVIRAPECGYWCQLFGGRRTPLLRLIPDDPRPYRLPRSVGATTMIPDMSEGPLPWWPLTTGRPFSDSVSSMVDEEVTAIGVLLRAHPTINYFENIRRAFRNPSVEILVVSPLHWSSWNEACSGYEAWLNFPPDIFDMLYGMYAGQDKAIIILTNESDWGIHGTGCRGREECNLPANGYDWCMPACEAGALVPYDVTPDGASCSQQCCDMLKVDRAEYLLTLFNEWQAAAEDARANHPDALLRVFFAIELNMYDTEDWQFMTIAEDIIPRMDSPPDFIGLSLYGMADDVGEAFDWAVEKTGLPPYRVFASEFGAREGTQPDGSVIDGTRQYDRITSVVNTLFAKGTPFALVWSWEEVAWTGGHTGFAVIDPVTAERLSGWTAIQDLNEIYREE